MESQQEQDQGWNEFKITIQNIYVLLGLLFLIGIGMGILFTIQPWKKQNCPTCPEPVLPSCPAQNFPVYQLVNIQQRRCVDLNALRPTHLYGNGDGFYGCDSNLKSQLFEFIPSSTPKRFQIKSLLHNNCLESNLNNSPWEWKTCDINNSNQLFEYSIQEGNAVLINSATNNCISIGNSNMNTTCNYSDKVTQNFYTNPNDF